MKRMTPFPSTRESAPTPYFHFQLHQGIPDPNKTDNPWEALRQLKFHADSD